MQPIGMARSLLGFAPFVQHRQGDALQFGILLVGADIGGQLHPVAIGIEEIDRFEDSVMGRPKNIDPQSLDVILRREQLFF